MITISKCMNIDMTLVADEDQEQLDSAHIDINENSSYPDNIMLTMLWVTQMRVSFPADKHDPYSLSNFQQALNKHGIHGYQRVMEDFWSLYAQAFDSQRKLLKILLAPPAIVNSMPPESTCPRCDHHVWQSKQDSEIPERPNPLYCLNCGQLFRYTELGDLWVKEIAHMDRIVQRITGQQVTHQQLREVPIIDGE